MIDPVNLARYMEEIKRVVSSEISNLKIQNDLKFRDLNKKLDRVLRELNELKRK